MWRSITRRGHIKSRYLQTVPIVVHVLPPHADMQRVCWWWEIKVNLWGHKLVPLVNPISELFWLRWVSKTGSVLSFLHLQQSTVSFQQMAKYDPHLTLPTVTPPAPVFVHIVYSICLQSCIFLFSIFQSLDAHFGFKQWPTPMDDEFALQVGSLFLWSTRQTQLLHSFLFLFFFLTPYIFNIIKNKLLRIHKKVHLCIWKISLSLLSVFFFFVSFFFMFPAHRGGLPSAVSGASVRLFCIFTPSYRSADGGVKGGVGAEEGKRERGDRRVGGGWRLATRWPWERRLRNRWSWERLHRHHLEREGRGWVIY